MATSSKKDFFYLHVCITLILMFGVGLLPPIAPITPEGMKILGIFFALIYAWSTTSLLWPSLLGIIAIIAEGIVDAETFLGMSFGNSTVLLLIFMMVFAVIIDELGLIRFIAAWFTSRKIIFGRPWLFSFIFLMGAFIGSIFVNGFPVVIIFWSIFYGIAKQVGFKPYDKYCTIMLLGIVFVCMTLGASVMPFRLGPLLITSTLSAAAGVHVNFVDYVLFSLPSATLLVCAYVLICRFVIRPDVTPLKNLNIDFVNPDNLKLNKKQKIAIAFLIALIILMVLPEVLPDTLLIQNVLSRMGMTTITILLIIVGCLVKIDGAPVLNFGKAIAQGVNWDITILFAIVLPLSTLLTSDDTGIKAFLAQILAPLLSTLSPLVLIIVVTAILTILTNFANNAVLGVIMINILCSISADLNISVIPIVISFVWFSQFAYLTPAASGPAAVVFGNSEWIKTKDIYALAPIWAILYLITLCLIVPYAYLIF